jgi:hypothetical protein
MTPAGPPQKTANRHEVISSPARRLTMRALVLFAILACAVQAADGHARPLPPGAQSPANRTIVCRDGVLRWKDDGREVALFGVNYYPPFSINFQDLATAGADREQTIRDDVAHFVRLGLDMIRLHCWDREISDPQGNLLDNEHLRLLDFLLAECKRNGIYAMLTPIAWWGTSEPSQGFSNLYPMPRMTTDPKAWEAQERYLAQFVQHRNRYTGTAYGDEPSIVAFELINEPIYPDGITDARVTAYIDALTGAVRQAGCAKPIFFNGWGHQAAVGRSTADGGTFSWYPTGLVSGHCLRGNYLPRVADFPEMRLPVLVGKAIGVYEFDAADVAEGYMYPAMARSFRAGGAQFAAQFQYDPMPLARFNAGWQTHYLNLIYTPHKALSFLIAADAFHNLPRHHSWRSYPANCRFGEYRVSWNEALSERVGETAFLYCNTTRSRPPRPERLHRIAGCGSSPVVSYEGTGAYFLDRLAPGTWRLEVYPDDVWVTDPFADTWVGKEVSRVYWRLRGMRISLPDLGERFMVSGTVGAGQTAHAGTAGQQARNGRIAVMPGVYILRRPGASPARADWHGARFVAPAEQPSRPTAVWHDPPAQWASGSALPIRATVAARGAPEVTTHYRTGSGAWRTAPLRSIGSYKYAGEIPAAGLRPGTLFYYLTVAADGHTALFPGGAPYDSASVSRPPAPATLWECASGMKAPDLALGGAPGQTGSAEIAGLSGGKAALRLSATGFGEGTSAGGVRVPASAPPDPAKWTTLAIRARSLLPDTTSVEVGLVQDDGNAFGCIAPLNPGWSEWRIPICKLTALWSTRSAKPDLGRLHEISLVFGAWLYGGAAARPHALEVERVWLEATPSCWQVPVTPLEAEIPAVTPSASLHLSGIPGSVSPTQGKSGPAIRVSVPGFGPPPSCVSWNSNVRDLLRPWQTTLARRTGLRIRARAGEPGTTALEVVVTEEDGAPWGTTIKLTSEWQDINLPWSSMRFYGHWAHPSGRGGPGDRFHPGRLAEVNFCFGAWLFPQRAAERHAVELEGVWLVP